MNLSDYRTHINQAISDENPYGSLLTNEPDFEFIESQMMMIGSLSQVDIQWDKVEKICVQILSETSKDVRVLSYLIQVLQHLPDLPRYSLSMAILYDFLNQYWDNALPYTDQRGERRKARVLTQILQRSVSAYELLSLDEFAVNSEEFRQLSHSLNKIMELIDQYYPDKNYSDELKSIRADIDSFGLDGQLNAGALITAESKDKSKGETTSDPSKNKDLRSDNGRRSEPIVVKLPEKNITYDRTNEYGFKKTVDQIAHFFREINDWALFIRSRRIGIWHTIDSAPLHDDEGKTELTAVPPSIVAHYREKINLKEVDQELWLKLEESIYNSPYWFQGHHLSYQVAKLLDYDLVANAIKECVLQFINSLPELKNLKFRDNTPFMPDDIQAWLEEEKTTDVKVDAPIKSENRPQVIQTDIVSNREIEAVKLYEEQGFQKTLEEMNQSLNGATNLRDEIYWRMAIANIFVLQEMPKLALESYQYINFIIEKTSIHDWEPDLIMMINQKIDLLDE